MRYESTQFHQFVKLGVGSQEDQQQRYGCNTPHEAKIWLLLRFFTII